LGFILTFFFNTPDGHLLGVFMTIAKIALFIVIKILKDEFNKRPIKTKNITQFFLLLKSVNLIEANLMLQE